jgi:hypothetical protein
VVIHKNGIIYWCSRFLGVVEFNMCFIIFYYKQKKKTKMSKLEKLYEQSLMKWGFNWLPATPPGTYLHSFDEFKQKMESDNEFYNKVVKELNQKEDE